MLSNGISVAWVDDDFNGGALSKYRDVPANTKVDILAGMGTADFLPDGLPRGAMAVLEQMASAAHPLHLDHDPASIGWTGLDQCHDFFMELTNSLLAHDDCVGVLGRVDALSSDTSDGSGGWRARVIDRRRGGAVFDLEAPAVVMATGALAVPTPPSLQPSGWAGPPARPPRVLPVESALQLPALRDLVQPHESVGVIGGGHTGMVVTMHLAESLRTRRTSLFVRRPIRLAEWDAAQSSYVHWAFRGLKGRSARFALDHGLVGAAPPNGPVGDGSIALELHDSRKLHTCQATAAALDAVVYCLGFGAPPLPSVRQGAATISISGHECPGGGLLDADGQPIAGLYGCGLGFSDSEYTSGAAYAEAGFMPFAQRAREIATSVAASVR